jgi:hypothetical protein
LTIFIKSGENNFRKPSVNSQKKLYPIPKEQPMTLRLTALAALLGAMTMTAQAGVLTLDGVTFTSSWSGNVLTLDIDAARRSGGWSGVTGLAALAIKGVGTYSSVSVSGGPGGTDAWTLSTSEL